MIRFVMKILCTILIFILIGCEGKPNGIYERYRYPAEEFYGKELYSEIDYICTEEERKAGDKLVKTALSILSCSGEESLNQEVGGLKAYYAKESYPDTAFTVCEVRQITTKIMGERGHVWAVYSVKRFGKDGEIVNQSEDILTLWIIEKKNGEYLVASVVEAP